MCWSLEVSLVTATVVTCAVAYLFKRQATPRDIHHAIFLSVFGFMQHIDAMLWYLNSRENLEDCSNTNFWLSRLALVTVMLEPFASLYGLLKSTGRSATKMEKIAYFFLFIGLPWLGRKPFSPCGFKTVCTTLTSEGHINYCTAAGGEKDCWLTMLFFGDPTHEIPLFLRFFFLMGMVYPYLQSNPVASGVLQSLILTATWTVGLYSDSHASVWCLANVAQIITMVADPHLFPMPQEGSPIKRGKREAITQDRFMKDRVPGDLDAVFIGSGAGALATAALMAKEGKRVLVLEQHYRAGGCTHTFDEFGNLFDSGIHYVGAAPELQFTLSHICDNEMNLAIMGTKDDGYTYDEFDLGNGESVDFIRFRKGFENVKAELKEKFPHEKDGIDRYFQQLTKTGEATHSLVVLKILPPFLQKLLFPLLYGRIAKHTKVSAQEKVAEYISDKKLQSLLNGGQLIDWNLEPDRTTWWVVGSMMNYYKDGGYYPEGGSHKFAEAVIPTIEKSGGRVLCRAQVETILFDESNKAVGVKVNGLDVYADLVVSDAGATNTYEKLIPKSVLKSVGLEPVIRGVGASHGHMTAFVNLDNVSSEFDLRQANIHSMPQLKDYDFDISKMQRAFYEDPWCQDEPLMTLTCPSAKDPQYEQDFPGTSNVLLLTEANYAWFKRFGELPYPKRSEEYKEWKKKWEKVFLDRLYKYYPKTKGHVKSIEIGTPMSTEHFLAAPEGGSYGLEWTVDRFDKDLMINYLDPKTKFKNLWLTGEAPLFGGFCGALVSGYVTATRILGFSGMLRVLMNHYRAKIGISGL